MKKEEDGIIWYSEAFLLEQLRAAEWNGFTRGIRIDFHSVTPNLGGRSMDEAKNEFKSFCEKKMIKP